MRTLEEYISALQEIDETEQNSKWLKADLLLQAKQDYGGKGFANTMAENLGYSARRIQELIKVAKTFSQEYRYPHISFTIYQICARTKEPLKWLERANDELLSVRQLQEEIRAEKDTGDLDERCRKAGERIVRSIREFREKYSESDALQEQLGKIRESCC